MDNTGRYQQIINKVKSLEHFGFRAEGNTLENIVVTVDLNMRRIQADIIKNSAQVFGGVVEIRRLLGFKSRTLIFNNECTYTTQIIIKHCPRTWADLFDWLRVRVHSYDFWFAEDEWVAGFHKISSPRTLVESRCALRPETVAVLHDLDTFYEYWPEDLYPDKDVNITTFSSYDRKEIVYATDMVLKQPAESGLVVLVSETLSDAKLEQLESLVCPPWYLATVGGVLGVAPIMTKATKKMLNIPRYTVGVLNQGYALSKILQYFQRNSHSHVIYCGDLFGPPLRDALAQVHGPLHPFAFLSEQQFTMDVYETRNLYKNEDLNITAGFCFSFDEDGDVACVEDDLPQMISYAMEQFMTYPSLIHPMLESESGAASTLATP